MAKERLNLSIDRSAVARGRRYSKLHRTSISKLVGDFLAHLPVDTGSGSEGLTPTVRRLLGVAVGGPGRQGYRRYLLEKYGG